MRRTLLFPLLLFVIFVTPAWAKEFHFDADHISYGEGGKAMTARGAVTAQYGDIAIQTENLTYEAASGEVFVDGGFVLKNPPHVIEGERLRYHVESQRGEAWGVKTHFKESHFLGDHLTLSPNFLSFQNAQYSSCPGDPPSYRVSARAIDLDLEDGLVVARWGLFWLGSIPVFPVPAYIHPLGAIFDNGRRQTNSPFPMIGRNDEDGTYGFWSSNFVRIGPGRGIVFLGYSTLKRGQGEIQYSIQPLERMSWEMRAGGSQGDGLWGGIDLRIRGKESEKKNTSTAPSLFAWEGVPGSLSNAWIKTTYTVRERINFQRVSKHPSIEFHAAVPSALFRGLDVDLETNVGKISEESTQIDVFSARLAPEMRYTFNSRFGKPSARLAYDFRRYSNDFAWSQGWASAEWQLPETRLLRTKLLYALPFHLRGSSPFRYEQYRFFGEPYYGIVTRWPLASWFIELEGEYNLPSNSPKERNITLGLGGDCLEFSLKWMSEQKLLSFGINLITR